jgi:Zn-dependent M28 family amino/carboxypeptidase
MTFDTALAGSGLVAASASGDVAQAVFAAVPDKSLEAVQKEMDSGNPHVAGFAVPGLTLTVKADVARERQTGHNVAGFLPASMTAPALEKPWVVIGAHYDHLAAARTGSSLASKEQAGQVHHGADDNASGTSAVLAIADALSKQPRKRNLMVAFWSAEELGLIGSNHFVTTPPVPTTEMAAYLNFDMVGRSADNKLTVQATGTSPMWPRMLEQANVAAGFDLILQEDPYQPTDVSSFNQAGVASLAFFTGAHVDYHKPTDTAEKINYEDLDRIAEFATGITRASWTWNRRRSSPRSNRRPRVAAAPACASSPARSRTTPPRSRACCWAVSSAAARPSRRACRRATSSSRSPGSPSPTSTTTPTRWSCSRLASRQRWSTCGTASAAKRN